MKSIFNKKEDRTGRFCYRYPHAAITADVAVFGFDGQGLKILLVERGTEPYIGMYALPGGFMLMDETIETTAARELREETGVEKVVLWQFKVFSSVNRDPRERVVTVAFIGLVRSDQIHPRGGDDARFAHWFDVDGLPPLAFDHADIIAQARRHLSETIRIRPLAFDLLNETFTVSELQKVYEVINRTSYDRRNFMRKLMQSDIVHKVDDCNNDTPRRPSRPAGRFIYNKGKLTKPDYGDDSESGPSDEGSIRDLFNY